MKKFEMPYSTRPDTSIEVVGRVITLTILVYAIDGWPSRWIMGFGGMIKDAMGVRSLAAFTCQPNPLVRQQAGLFMRFQLQHALILVLLACLLAAWWEPAAKFVETFAYIFVAITAVWQQQFVDLISPANARVEILRGPSAEWQNDPHPNGHIIIHGKVWATNPDRPLVRARLLFDKIQYDESSLVELPVPFQLPWAPSESDRAEIAVGKDYEVFDLGKFELAPSPLDVGSYDPVNPAPGLPYEMGFSVTRRMFQGGFPMRECAFKKATVHFFLRADNLRKDHRMVLVVDVQNRTWCVKEWGTDF